MILWLLPWFLSLCTLTFIGHDPDVSNMTGAGAGISSLFGPWTTLVAKLFNVPYAGAFFSLWFATGLTLAIGAIVLLSIKFHKKWITAISIIAYIPLILLWTLSGWGQMVCCMR